MQRFWFAIDVTEIAQSHGDELLRTDDALLPVWRDRRAAERRAMSCQCLHPDRTYAICEAVATTKPAEARGVPLAMTRPAKCPMEKTT